MSLIPPRSKRKWKQNRPNEKIIQNLQIGQVVLFEPHGRLTIKDFFPLNGRWFVKFEEADALSAHHAAVKPLSPIEIIRHRIKTTKADIYCDGCNRTTYRLPDDICHYCLSAWID